MSSATPFRSVLRWLTITSITLVSCGAALAAPCAAVPADADKVTETMKQMYVAATNDDYHLWHQIIAPQFYAYDGGKLYEGDALIDLIKNAHAGGMKLVWTVQEPKVHLECNDAWITYINRGSIEDKTGIKPINWLESANLHKTNGEWKLVFFHSTRVPVAQ